MSESNEENVVSTKRTYGYGKDIFGKYNPDKLVVDGSTDYSTDEDEDEIEEEDEEDEDEEDEKEEDVSRKTKNIKFDHGMS